MGKDIKVDVNNGCFTNTGDTEFQIRNLEKRIENLTRHVQKNKKDNVTKRSLIMLVSKKRKLDKYLDRISKKKQ